MFIFGNVNFETYLFWAQKHGAFFGHSIHNAISHNINPCQLKIAKLRIPFDSLFET